ncbi:acyl-CoA carboxylase subunit epsilon, partial [Streptosporangium minutum]|uniref:acyl-CoA carboxylase subunit epsilon n=1 Tax=Streptosporangium minutum TaxID=569862 RepID=UPI001A98B8C2
MGERPLLRVVRGNPTPEELVALIAVVLARESSAAAVEAGPSAWADRSRSMRQSPVPNRRGVGDDARMPAPWRQATADRVADHAASGSEFDDDGFAGVRNDRRGQAGNGLRA